MTCNDGSTLFAMLAGLGVLAGARAAALAVAFASIDARAATFAVEPLVAEVGGTVHFRFTTEVGEWPDGWAGAESPSGLHFNGPCTNSVFFGSGSYGIDGERTLPGPGWTNYMPVCMTWSRAGAYVATFTYGRLDATGLSTNHTIDIPFTVLAKLELKKYPQDHGSPVGDTALVETRGMFPPGEVATEMRVDCPDGGTDHAVDLAAIRDGFATSYPGAFFQGTCGPTLPSVYIATLTTSLGRTASVGFSFYGDRDGDGWFDRDDNCPSDPNPDQQDSDGDRRGDACDDDRDNDGRGDADDNCPDARNSSQDDLDADGLGDACDPDIEDDGVPNATDNCDYHWNPGQENIDGDPFGDPCDPDPDDADNDGFSDLVDNCWTVFNPGQQDLDLDGIGTACDPDIDGDGISNDEEWASGTDPLDHQALDPGINEFFDGTPLGPGGSAVEGEPVGVVVNPATGASSVDVTVTDPFGNPYLQDTLIPQSPVVFWFVPIWPGEWRIDAEPDAGEAFSATLQVIPEPDAVAAAITAVLGLGLTARRLRACHTR